MHICWNPRTHVLPVNVPVGRGDGSEKKMFKLHVMLICLSRFLRGPNSQLSVINWVGIRLSRYNVFSRRLIVRAPPPPGFFFCWVGFKPKIRRKKTPPEEQLLKSIKFGGCSSEGPSSSGLWVWDASGSSSCGVLVWKPPHKEKLPRRALGGFLTNKMRLERSSKCQTDSKSQSRNCRSRHFFIWKFEKRHTWNVT